MKEMEAITSSCRELEIGWNETDGKMGNRETWKQKHVNPMCICHRWIHVIERLTQKAGGQLRGLGLGIGVELRQAVAALFAQ